MYDFCWFYWFACAWYVSFPTSKRVWSVVLMLVYKCIVYFVVLAVQLYLVYQANPPQSFGDGGHEHVSFYVVIFLDWIFHGLPLHEYNLFTIWLSIRFFYIWKCVQTCFLLTVISVILCRYQHWDVIQLLGVSHYFKQFLYKDYSSVLNFFVKTDIKIVWTIPMLPK